MEKLEQLKKEMLDAREVYDVFVRNNSRELTEEEKQRNQESVSFGIGAEKSEPRILELTLEKIDEMNSIQKKMKDTHSAFVEEYMKTNKK